MGGRKTQLVQAPLPQKFRALQGTHPEIFEALLELHDYQQRPSSKPFFRVSADPDVTVNNTWIPFNKLIKDTHNEIDLGAMRWNPLYPNQPYLVSIGVRLQTALAANEVMDLQLLEREGSGFAQNLGRYGEAVASNGRRLVTSVIFEPKPGTAYWPVLLTATAPVTTINNSDGYTFFSAKYLGDVLR